MKYWNWTGDTATSKVLKAEKDGKPITVVAPDGLPVMDPIASEENPYKGTDGEAEFSEISEKEYNNIMGKIMGSNGRGNKK